MDDRMHPEMRAAKQMMDQAAAALPQVSLEPPLDASRAINDQLLMKLAEGGPRMHHSADVFIAAHGRRIQCRLHKPVDKPDLPILVWFHGGGWVWSSIDTHDRLVREYAAAGEVATVNVDYSLAPEAKFPRAVFEAADAIRQIAHHAHAWGLDPSRIAVGGDSAGGNLALAAAMLLRDTNGPALRGLLPVYPVTEAACDTLSYQEFGEDYGLTRVGMRAYWDLYLSHPADRYNPLASPLRGDVGGLPPTYLPVAELDVLRDEGIAMAEKMKAAGVDVTLEICPGVLHGFMRLTGHVTVARESVAKAGEFLKRVMA